MKGQHVPVLCSYLVRAEVRGLLAVHRPHRVRHQVCECRLWVGNRRAGQEDKNGVNQREHNYEEGHSGEMEGTKGDTSEGQTIKIIEKSQLLHDENVAKDKFDRRDVAGQREEEYERGEGEDLPLQGPVFG